jgi:CheY-like chemotaxis protein
MVSTTSDREHLRGLRVLVVEDEFLLAIAVEEDLRAAGCVVVGPIGSLGPAMAAATTETFSAAVIDMNLNGTMAYPLADQLAERGIPFLLLTGYDRADLPERLRAVPRITKPYDAMALVDQLARVARPAR